MAVSIVLGKANSGKTVCCFRAMEEAAAKGKKVLLIVPDQGTYEAERRYAESLQGRGFMGTRISGFSRLARQVTQGGSGDTVVLNDFDKRLVLRRLADAWAPSFTVLQQAMGQPGFAATASAFITECRSFGIDAETLKNAGKALETGVLKQKISDISLLYEKYDEYLQTRFGSTRDLLTALAEDACRDEFLQGAYIWIDGFQWFTPQQMQVIQALARCAEETVITLTMNPEALDGQQRETALHRRAYEAYESLCRIFPAVHVRAVGDSAYSTLRAFRDDFFSTVPKFRDASVEGIRAVQCNTRHEEVRYVAGQICHLLRQGRRLKDITVITRTSDPYNRICKQVFAEYGLPCFTDYRRPMTTHPYVEAVTAVREILFSHLNNDALFRLLKTDLLPFSRREADDLENYSLAAGIRPLRWLKDEDFTYMPERLRNRCGDLSYINDIRRRIFHIMEPLLPFRGEKKSLYEWAGILWQWTYDTQMQSLLAEWQEEAESEGRQEEAREHEQVSKKITALLTRMVELCGNDEISGKEFCDLLEEGLTESEFTLIPPTLDRITVTSIDRGYTMRSPIVFVCGVNDGVFPVHYGEDGLLNDKERNFLKNCGLPLGPDSRFKTFQERFFFYLALTRADEYLHITWSLADEGGEALMPSPWVGLLVNRGYVKAESDTGTITVKNRADYLVNARAALHFLPSALRSAKDGERIDDIWWALYDWALLNGYDDRVHTIGAGLFYNSRAQALSKGLIESLFLKNKTLRGSVTLLEAYRKCPFAFFAKYGLKLKERQEYDFAAPDLGTLVHAVLRCIGERLLEEGRPWRELKDDEILSLCTVETERAAAEAANNILMSDAYFRQIKNRVVATLVRTVRQLRDFSEGSEFSVRALEQPFGTKGAWKGLSFTLPDGVKVELVGQIDRVDTLELDGRTFILIVDYKSGKKSITLPEVYSGLELQLFLYMAVARRNLGSKAVPAGAVYCRVRNDVQRCSAEPTAAEKERAYIKAGQLSGFYLNDSDVVRALDDCTMEGRAASPYSGLKINNDGTLKKAANVSDEAEWYRLLRLVEAAACRSASELTGGCIDIYPARWGSSNEHKACDYCPYAALCRFDVTAEDGNSWNYLGNLSIDDLFPDTVIVKDGGQDGVD